jgi:hypothetical protein
MNGLAEEGINGKSVGPTSGEQFPMADATKPDNPSKSEADPLDQLWKETYALYYDAHYYEIESELIVQKWQRIDDIVRVVVAVTASSSAVAGWSLWSDPAGKTIWACIAGSSALVAIVHAALGVPARLKEWGEIHRLFLVLRNDIQTLRQQMRIQTGGSTRAIQAAFDAARTRFTEGESKIKSDLLRTNRLRNAAQRLLDERIKRTIDTKQRSENEI